MGFVTETMRRDAKRQAEAEQLRLANAGYEEKQRFLEPENIDSIVEMVQAGYRKAYPQNIRAGLAVGVKSDTITSSVVSDNKCRETLLVALVRADSSVKGISLFRDGSMSVSFLTSLV